MFGWVGEGSCSQPDIRCLGGSERGVFLNQISGVSVRRGRGAVLYQISGVWVGGRGKLFSTRYQVFGWVGEGSCSQPNIRCLGGWGRGAVLNQISGVWVGGKGELFSADIRCFGEEGNGAVLNQISGVWVSGGGQLFPARYQVFAWVGELF